MKITPYARSVASESYLYTSGSMGVPRNKAFRYLWVIASITLASFLGWIAIRSADWGSIQGAFGKVSWNVLLLAFTAVVCSIFLQAVRWKLLLPGEKVSTTRLFLVRNAGQSINNLLPGRGVLGEASELAILTKSDKIAGNKIIASIYMNRAMDFIVNAALILTGLFFIPQFLVFRSMIIPVLVAAVSVFLIILLARRISCLPRLKKIKEIESSLHAVDFVQSRRLIFCLSLALTVVIWMFLGIAAWLVAQALGIQLPFWMISILMVGVSLFAGAIPGAPASMGTYEFATVYMLGLFAIDKSDALTFALLIHSLHVFPPIIIGIVVLSREGKSFAGVATQIGDLFNRKVLRRLSTQSEKPVVVMPEVMDDHPLVLPPQAGQL